MRRRLTLLIPLLTMFGFLAAGTATAAPPEAPPGAVATTPGQTDQYGCPEADQQILAATATYYAKNAKLVATVAPFDYTYSAVGDKLTAYFLAPKKAAFVTIDATCGPITQVFTGERRISVGQGCNFADTTDCGVWTFTCPDGLVIDREASTLRQMLGWPTHTLAEAPVLLDSTTTAYLNNPSQVEVSNNLAPWLNATIPVAYSITCVTA